MKFNIKIINFLKIKIVIVELGELTQYPMDVP